MYKRQNYSPYLAGLPEVVVVSKAEGIDDEMREDIESQLRKVVKQDTAVYFMSAQAHQGIDEVLKELYRAVTTTRADEEEADEEQSLPVYDLTDKELSREWHVTKQKKHFLVTGERIEVFAQKTYFDDYHSLQRLQDIMNKLGIMHELVKQKYKTGDEVVIGNPEIGRFTL